MSQLSQIKAQINQVATNASQTAAALNNFSQTLQNNIAVVNNTIGGTASNDDKEMVAALQQAQQAVKNAAMQLNQAATKAKNWASKA